MTMGALCEMYTFNEINLLIIVNISLIHFKTNNIILSVFRYEDGVTRAGAYSTSRWNIMDDV
jgi:hypothetical protein